MKLSITNSLFELYPGQAFLSSVSAHSANLLQPLIYFPCCAPGNGVTTSGTSWNTNPAPPYNGGGLVPPRIRLFR
jgi:hypothetical protein